MQMLQKNIAQQNTTHIKIYAINLTMPKDFSSGYIHTSPMMVISQMENKDFSNHLCTQNNLQQSIA